MRRITIHYISGYALSFVLSFVGLIVLVAVLWEAWPNVAASDNVFSALEEYLWTRESDFGFGVRLKLMHLTMMSAGALVLGIFVLTFSRQVLYAGEGVLLQCPFCKNQWKVSQASGWAQCPYCHQFVQTTVVKN